MARELNATEMLLVSGGQDGGDGDGDDEDEDEDTVTTTGIQWVTQVAAGDLGFYSSGGSYGSFDGDAGGGNEFEGGGDDVIVVTAQQVDDALEAIGALQFLVDMQNVISESMDALNLPGVDPSNIDEIFKELGELLDNFNKAADAAEIIALIANGEIQAGISNAINVAFDMGGTALVTAMFAGIGVAVGGSTTLGVGAAPGGVAGAISGFLLSTGFSIATEDVRAEISDALAEVVIDLIVAAGEGAEALAALIADLGATLDDIGNMISSVVDTSLEGVQTLVDGSQDEIGGVPQDMSGPNSAPSGPPPSIFDELFDERPGPGYEWR